jgi:hypothetical protein
VSAAAAVVRPYGLARADLLKLRRRRGLFWTIALMTIGIEVVVFTVLLVLHAVNPAHHGPAGGVSNLGHAMLILNLLGAIAATVAGSSAGADDLTSGVFRELVVTGRSRLQLYAARVPGGLAFLLPFTLTAYCVAAVVTVAAAGSLPRPSSSLLVEGALWVLAEAAFYFVVGMGLASLTGSRAYTIGILLAWRLVLARIMMAIGFLGAARDVVPDVSFTHLAPGPVSENIREGAAIGISAGTAVTVLLLWVAVWFALGAWRTVTRDA